MNLFRLATLIILMFVAFFAPPSLRADFTFDVIVPEQYNVNTGDFPNGGGSSRGFGWLVVTSGLLPNSALQFSIFTSEIDNPAVIPEFRLLSLLNVGALGDMVAGDVAGGSNLGYTLQSGEELVTGSSFWGISFDWPGTINGSANLNATWTIGNQIVEFTAPFNLTTDSGGPVTANGQRRFSSQTIPVPEPSAILIGSLIPMVAASRWRGRQRREEKCV